MGDTTTYDVIVIGAGPAGENAADRAGRSGLRVAVVERELAGGECSYWACMPSKALLRPGEALAAARRVPGVAAAITGEIDVEAVLDRRDALAGHWDDSGQVEWIESVGAEFIRGHGRLAGERRVAVTDDDGTVTTYEATTAVIVATGTGAAIPPVEGLREIRTWDNREITTAKEVPRRLLIVGGGVVGVEMAQAWKSLGSEEVTVVELLPRLLSREEPFVGEEIAEALANLGVTVLTDTRLAKVSRPSADGPVTAHLERNGGPGRVIEADEIVVAAGRRPHTDDLGLDTIRSKSERRSESEGGLEPGGYLDVDDRMRVTAVPDGWLYAVGDVNGRSLLTHTGKYQARIAGDHIAGEDVHAWGDEVAVPRVVFTDPQVAAVGKTEEEARAAGIDVRVVKRKTAHVAGAATLGRGIPGSSQLVIDADREVVVGATFVGPGAGELLHAATIAIVAEVPLRTLWHAIPAFPTVSEMWLRFLEDYGL